MPAKRDRVVQIGRAHLARLAGAWHEPRDSRLGIAVNTNLRSALARWIPPSDVLEISAAAEWRGARALGEIITHEAAHVVGWERLGRAARPHGSEWAALMRAAGFEPRATLIRCGHRSTRSENLRVRHFCTVCHF